MQIEDCFQWSGQLAWCLGLVTAPVGRRASAHCPWTGSHRPGYKYLGLDVLLTSTLHGPTRDPGPPSEARDLLDGGSCPHVWSPISVAPTQGRFICILRQGRWALILQTSAQNLGGLQAEPLVLQLRLLTLRAAPMTTSLAPPTGAQDLLAMVIGILIARPA